MVTQNHRGAKKNNSHFGMRQRIRRASIRDLQGAGNKKKNKSYCPTQDPEVNCFRPVQSVGMGNEVSAEATQRRETLSKSSSHWALRLVCAGCYERCSLSRWASCAAGRNRKCHGSQTTDSISISALELPARSTKKKYQPAKKASRLIERQLGLRVAHGLTSARLTSLDDAQPIRPSYPK